MKSRSNSKKMGGVDLTAAGMGANPWTQLCKKHDVLVWLYILIPLSTPPAHSPGFLESKCHFGLGLSPPAGVTLSSWSLTECQCVDGRRETEACVVRLQGISWHPSSQGSWFAGLICICSRTLIPIPHSPLLAGFPLGWGYGNAPPTPHWGQTLPWRSCARPHLPHTRQTLSPWALYAKELDPRNKGWFLCA